MQLTAAFGASDHQEQLQNSTRRMRAQSPATASAPGIVAVRALLDTALAAMASDPETAHANISRACWLLEGALDSASDGYRLLPSPGALAPWQEKRAKELLEASMIGFLDMDRIARACDLPTPQFTRAFLRSTGLSVWRWLRARRVERAKELLFSSSLTLVQITYECGYSDQAHFTRAFSAATGTCPGAWRRARRQD
jgi:AraC-like DNA-binding protein